MPSEALFFGAHPDDIEFSCGGLAALLASHGHAVGLVDLTRGELGTRGDVAVREREAAAAARALGVGSRECLGLPDGGLDRHDRAQLAAVVGAIRRHRPSLVVAPHRADAHPDHVETSHLVTRGCYLAGLAKFAPGEPRWRPARLLYALYRGETPPTLIVDITPVWEARVAAIAAHASQLDPAAGEPTYLTSPGFLAEVEARARLFGVAGGCTWAEGYRVRGPLALRDARALLGPAERVG
ncbi:MAG: bacillithiol biosynthesis deacetylase BshB1 [Candidatus Eisenbacteria bacterium]|nr:bacillithiol biosynthesis deacetylase BshB1 [Candidatus Eisenbacteria bacterium]